MKNTTQILFLAFLFISISCKKETQDAIDSNQKVFGIFEIKSDTLVYMNGEIGSNSLKNFNDLISIKPNIKLIEIFECPGSSDDEINLQVSAKIHQLNINTRIIDNGYVASGGVDFFLAGIQRSKGVNISVGVHSWASDTNEASDYPVGHAFHLEYINYYKSIGFSQQAAEDFYYFTINAAPASGIHWMSESELILYKIFNN